MYEIIFSINLKIPSVSYSESTQIRPNQQQAHTSNPVVVYKKIMMIEYGLACSKRLVW